MEKKTSQKLYVSISAVPVIALMINGLLILHAYLILGEWPRPYINDPMSLSDSILWQLHFYTTIFSILLWIFTIIIWPFLSIYIYKHKIVSKKFISIASILFVSVSLILYLLLNGNIGNWLID